MAQINTAVYGASEDWIDAAQYPSGATESQKLKLANFDDTAIDKSIISTALAANKLTLETPWDNTLSYAGLGPNHPLSRLTWWVKPGDGTNIISVVLQEERSVTNYALGQSSSHISGSSGDTAGGYVLTNMGGYVKAKFDRWNDGQQYSDSYSNYRGFKPFTQIPLHRVVAYPIIICSSSNNDDFHSMSLTAYLQGNNKRNYPRVRQILMGLSVQLDTSVYTNIDYDWKTWEEEHPGQTYTVTRTGVSDLSTIAMLEYTSAFNGLETDAWGPLGTTQTMGDAVYLPIVAGRPYNYGNGICVAGDLFGAIEWASNPTSIVLRPTGNGFGLNFDKIANPNVYADDHTVTSSSFFYCDASELSDDEFREGVRRIIASFGLFFTDTDADANLPLNHERMMLGVLEDGIGYGNYTNGDYNKDEIQWKKDDVHELPYDPSVVPSPDLDPNAYLDTMKWGELENFSTAIDRYNIKGTALTSLTRSLWELWDDYDLETVDIDSFAKMEIEQKKKFLTNNPIDCITGVKYFPIGVEMYESATNYNIKVGTVLLMEEPTPALGPVNIKGKLAKNSIHFDCGRVYCSPQYQTKENRNATWIDQYVSFELYLPFCGSVKLDTSTYIGKWVNVEYDIDLITGCCAASIGIASSEVSGYEFMEIRNGQCCIDVPITGIQQSTLEANLFNAVQGMKLSKSNYNYQINSLGIDFASNAVSALGSLGNQDYGGAAQSLTGAIKGFMAGQTAAKNREINVDTENYNLTHTQLPTRLIGTAGSLNSADCYLKPMLIVTKPVLDIPADYGKTTGFACLEHTTVGALGGYTECTNVKLDGFSCTDTEKEMIRALLAGGIYVPKST